MEIQILRKIDALGRVVIPKDIRRTLRLQCGDDIRITVENGTILIRKVGGDGR